MKLARPIHLRQQSVRLQERQKSLACTTEVLHMRLCVSVYVPACVHVCVTDAEGNSANLLLC